MFLDLLNENTELFVEATDLGITPDMAGIHEINAGMLQESFELEASLVYTSNKILMEGYSNLSEAGVGKVKQVFGNIFKRIKSIIMKMWAKIKEFFKNLKLFFDKLVMKGTKFADTYKDEIDSISTVTIDGYKINAEALDIKGAWSKLTSLANAVKSDDKEDTVLDNFAKGVCGKDKSGFKAGCQTKVGIFGKPVSISYSGSQIYKLLKGLNESLNSVSTDQNEVDGCYAAAIKIVDQLSNELEKVKPGSDDEKKENSKSKEALTNRANVLKSGLGMINVMAGIKAAALKSDANQAQKAAYKGIAEARKSKNK